MIYDCFSYWDEDLLLDLRLNILDKIVDRFVIVEGDKTWQNNPKKLKFDVKKFEKFKDKIIYIPVTDLPDGEDPYLRENHQRNSISKGIKDANEDDIILISDLDEIPCPKAIKNFDHKMRYATFKQKHFYYKFNLQSKSYPYWYGSRVCIKKYLKSPQWLRDIKIKKKPFWKIFGKKIQLISNGGWHFSFLKSPDSIKNKIISYSHQEYNKEEFTNTDLIKKRISLGEDLFDRKIKYKKVDIDESFPEYIYKNKGMFKDWII